MTGPELAVSLLIVIAAVVAQAATGSGFGIIAAPLLLMVDPELVPGPLLLITLIVMLVVTWQNRAGLRRFDLGYAMLGALPAAVGSLWILPLLDAQLSDIVVGSLVVVSVAAGLAGWRVRQGGTALCIAGIIGGVLGTVAATPGPPLVIVYQTPHLFRYRANLSAFFLGVCLTSLVGLILTRAFGTRELTTSLWLLPGVLIGGLVSKPVVRRLPVALIRPASLGLCLVAGAGLVLKGILG
jgi:hypothetical protein